MNRIFYILLFLTISGFGVLWWLLNSLPPEEEADVSTETPGLVIHDDAKHSEEKIAAQPPANTEASPVKTEAQADPAHETQPSATSGEETAKAALAKTLSAPASIHVESTPAGALVYLDGVLKGKTPFTFQLSSSDKVVRVELEGYERQERTIEDTVRDSGALSLWKFELKPQTPVARVAKFQETDFRMTGTRGPFFIQLKAVDSRENTGWLVRIQDFRDKLAGTGVFVCEVDLGAKGKWTRFLAGPYATKNEAQSALKPIQNSSGEPGSFVVGEQKCLE